MHSLRSNVQSQLKQRYRMAKSITGRLRLSLIRVSNRPNNRNNLNNNSNKDNNKSSKG